VLSVVIRAPNPYSPTHGGTDRGGRQNRRSSVRAHGGVWAAPVSACSSQGGKRVKVVILAGGVGTRLIEETDVRPKPMVEIGHRPILWHIMQHYAHFGHREFIVCLGYKGEYVKKYFSDSLAAAADLTIDFAKNEIELLETARNDWRVTLVDTGQTTQTAGRLQRVRPFLDGEPFLMTYGDGLSTVDLDDLIAFHRRHARLATVTAVHPPARFGKLTLEGSAVTRFDEKPQMSEGWINGGFFVLEPGVFDFIHGDFDWAREPLEELARAGELSAYCHPGFWQCMDTMRDKVHLNALWDSGDAPWKLWDM
jgi:glucose-1-phosphate cytidylyltransferase